MGSVPLRPFAASGIQAAADSGRSTCRSDDSRI